MNIFVLDRDPKVAAKLHCNKHVVKMILETAQLLSTVNSQLGVEAPYRPTHKNHPCTIWAGQSQENYQWLLELGLCLYDEYQRRYGGKIHKSGEVLLALTVPDASAFPQTGMTEFAQAMPDEYRRDDAVEAYLEYYLNDKVELLEDWLIPQLKRQQRNVRMHLQSDKRKRLAV